MNKILFLALTLFFLALTACTDDQTELLTIASETRIGIGEGPINCYLVKTGDSKNWEFMYSPIEGFEYEEGYEYVIEVKTENIDNPLIDGSSIKNTS